MVTVGQAKNENANYFNEHIITRLGTFLGSLRLEILLSVTYDKPYILDTLYNERQCHSPRQICQKPG